MYQNMPALAPQTQMFIQGCPPELQAKFERIQARELVMRTVLGLSAGVQKMICWQMLAGTGPRDDLMDLMYGKIGMLEFSDGKAAKRRPLASAYERMARFLAGVSRVTRIPCPARPSIYLFKVDRRKREPAFALWERCEPFSGEDSAPTAFRFAWDGSGAKAVDALGQSLPVELEDGEISLAVTDTPIYLERVHIDRH